MLKIEQWFFYPISMKSPEDAKNKEKKGPIWRWQSAWRNMGSCKLGAVKQKAEEISAMLQSALEKDTTYCAFF